jgi:caffeoyl-CoA O-methyltransferase
MKKNSKLEQYILEHIEPEDPVLNELSRETHQKVLGARMISGHLQGQVLTMLSKMIQPERILEIGTFTGYSAICLAKGLQQNGLLITIELDDELENLAAKYFIKIGLQNKIRQLIGPALEILPSVNELFDLVFLDADKREYVDYYKLVFDKVRQGGFIIADNTLWSGKVLEPAVPGDEQTAGIKKFNELIKSDARVEKVIFPFRDGMTVLRKK